MTTNFLGNPVRLVGELPVTGMMAPPFEGVRGDLSTITLGDLRGKRVVLNIFPSMDTDVCAASVRRFNKEASALENTVVLCLSKDLPFAQSRFCSVEGLNNVVAVSLFRNTDVDVAYGLRIKEGPMTGLLARAVVVVDEKGCILYEELVPEITQEPNYEAALAVLK